MNTFFPITEATFLPQHRIYPINHNNPIVLSDFDGTISLADVTDTLLEHFGQDGCEQLEEQWLDGKIGSQECMSKQIALIDASLEEMNEALADVAIDPHFKAFVKYLQKNNIGIQVVSDGLDFAIKTILANNDLDFLPVYANKLLHDNQRGWRLEFPYSNINCIKRSGNCKCAHVKQTYKQFSSILYVGDGSSDFCVSNKVDHVFAKDKLIDFCQQNHIDFSPISDFSDVTTLMQTKFAALTHPISKQHDFIHSPNKGIILS